MATKARFSKRVDAVCDDEDAGRGQQGQDHATQPILAAVESLVGQQPCAIVLDHAADRAEPRAMRLAYLADAGLDAVPQAEIAVLGTVISRVGEQLADGRADHLSQAQEMEKEPRIVDVGGRGNDAQRDAVGRRYHVVLGPALPRSVGLGPVSSPPRLARTEQRSTTTAQGAASGPARTIRMRAVWTRRSR